MLKCQKCRKFYETAPSKCVCGSREFRWVPDKKVEPKKIKSDLFESGGGIIEEFIHWFHSRGEFYAKLQVKFYKDGEPYFYSQGAECTLRDYLRFKNGNAR